MIEKNVEKFSTNNVRTVHSLSYEIINRLR